MLLMRAQRVCPWSRTALTTPGGGAVNCLCDQRPCYAGLEKNGMLLHQSPYLPTCKAKANEGVFAAEEPSHTPRIIRFSVLPIIHCPQTRPVKQASVKRLLRFS